MTRATLTGRINYATFSYPAAEHLPDAPCNQGPLTHGPAAGSSTPGAGEPRGPESPEGRAQRGPPPSEPAARARPGLTAEPPPAFYARPPSSSRNTDLGAPGRDGGRDGTGGEERPALASAEPPPPAAGPAAASYPRAARALRAAQPRAPASRRPETRRSAAAGGRRRAPGRRPWPPCSTSSTPWRPATVAEPLPAPQRTGRLCAGAGSARMCRQPARLGGNLRRGAGGSLREAGGGRPGPGPLCREGVEKRAVGCPLPGRCWVLVETALSLKNAGRGRRGHLDPLVPVPPQVFSRLGVPPSPPPLDCCTANFLGGKKKKISYTVPFFHPCEGFQRCRDWSLPVAVMAEQSRWALGAGSSAAPCHVASPFR